MALILGIGIVAAAALTLWRTFAGHPDTMGRARQVSGLVNAVSYAVSVIMDGLSGDRKPAFSGNYNDRRRPNVINGIRVPNRIGEVAGDAEN